MMIALVRTTEDYIDCFHLPSFSDNAVIYSHYQERKRKREQVVLDANQWLVAFAASVHL